MSSITPPSCVFCPDCGVAFDQVQEDTVEDTDFQCYTQHCHQGPYQSDTTNRKSVLSTLFHSISAPFRGWFGNSVAAVPTTPQECQVMKEKLRLPRATMSRHDQTRAWCQKLEHNKTFQALSSRDSGTFTMVDKTRKVEKKKELILNYTLKYLEEVKKLQKALDQHQDNREEEFKLLTDLAKSREDFNSEITECVKTQRAIVEKFISESSKLNMQFEIEERVNATQTEKALQEVQDKIGSDILNLKDSRNLLNLLEPP